MKRLSFASLASCLLFSCFGLRAEEAARTADPIIELPKFIVTDSRELPPPESWRYATMPGFEILSNASDKATQKLIRDFDMFRQALGYVWKIPDHPARPTALIICGRGAKFDAFVPAGKTDAQTARASLFFRNRDQTAIIIDLQATTLSVLADGADDPASGTDSSQVAVEHDKQLYREYVHYILSKAEPRLGAWFEEGLCQIIMRMKFDRRWIEYAKLEDPNTVSAEAAMIAGMNAAATADDPDAATIGGAPAEDRDFNAALSRKALVPLDRFFAVTHDSPEALNPLGNNRWAKQAYAFVHMCLYGEKGRYQKSFGNFLVRSVREPITEAMFKECFNKSYKDMLLALRAYIDFTIYESKEFHAKQDMILPPPPLALRDATESEVGRIKGETLILAGHPTEARAQLIAPYIRGERDPRLLASLGLFERTSGKDDDRARKFLQAAADGKVVRPDAYLELARFRYADAMAKPAGATGDFSLEQTKVILAPLLTACTQPPPIAGVYELMADAWAKSPAKPGKDDIAILIEGVKAFPTHLRLVFQTAVFCANGGMIPQAEDLVSHGLKLAPDATTRAHFEELKAALPPSTATPGPAAPKSAK